MNGSTGSVHWRWPGVVLLVIVLVAGALWWFTAAREGANETQPAPATQTSGKPGRARSVTGAAASAPARPDSVDAMAQPVHLSDLLTKFSDDQLRTIKAYYARYPDGMMAFATPEQLAWLRRRGFPMPEDIMRASYLTDRQLQQRAEAGDTLAAAFLAERLMQRSVDRQSYEDNALDLMHLYHRVIESKSPFSGYFYTRYKSFRAERDYPDAARRLSFDAQAIGSLWARMLGDARVPSPPKIARYLAVGECSRPGAVYAPLGRFFALMRHALRGGGSLVLSGPGVDRWPGPPNHGSQPYGQPLEGDGAG